MVLCLPWLLLHFHLSTWFSACPGFSYSFISPAGYLSALTSTVSFLHLIPRLPWLLLEFHFLISSSLISLPSLTSLTLALLHLVFRLPWIFLVLSRHMVICLLWLILVSSLSLTLRFTLILLQLHLSVWFSANPGLQY